MKICFTGPRLYKIGYPDDWKDARVVALILKIKEVVESIMNNNPTEKEFHFITGGALGIDQIAFAICDKLKKADKRIRTEVAVPFTMQLLEWTPEQKYKYTGFLKRADQISYVDTSEKYNPKLVNLGGFAPFKYQARNEYMVDQSEIVIAIYDGKAGQNGDSSGTYNCLKYATQQKRSIIYINPYNLAVTTHEYSKDKPQTVVNQEQLSFAI